MVRDKCETLMSIFLSWLQFMIACLKLCPTWWTFKRRLRNRGHFLNTYNKNVFQPSLCTAAPSPQKKKRRKKLTGRLSAAKKIEINIIYFYLFVYLLQFNGLLNAQPFLPPPPGRPPGISVFFALDGLIVGDPWAVKSPGVGTKKEGKCPVLRQHWNIFHWLHSRVVPWDFLFQLTSSFVIVLKSNLSLRTPLYYEQFVWSQKSQKSYIPSTSIIRTPQSGHLVLSLWWAY